MTGVSCQTFGLMVDVVKADAQKKKKTGRPTLVIEEQVLIVNSVLERVLRCKKMSLK